MLYDDGYLEERIAHRQRSERRREAQIYRLALLARGDDQVKAVQRKVAGRLQDASSEPSVHGPSSGLPDRAGGPWTAVRLWFARPRGPEHQCC